MDAIYSLYNQMHLLTVLHADCSQLRINQVVMIICM